jgi:preprotein translocase subunit YajC
MLAEATDSGQNQIVTMEEVSGTETATTSENGANGSSQDVPPKSPGSSMFLYVMLPLLLVYMFFMFRGPKKKQQEHQKMVKSLSKNDRVRTIGGIFGTVLDVRDDEIVLKIDESTNTKMRVSPQAIATVLTEKAD